MAQNRVFPSAWPVYFIEGFEETDRYFMPPTDTSIIARFYSASCPYKTLKILHTGYSDEHGADRFFRTAEYTADDLTEEGHDDVVYNVSWSDSYDAVLDVFFERAERHDFDL